MAQQLVGFLGDGPQLSTSLRKLLESKDCAVRQALSDAKKKPKDDSVTTGYVAIDDKVELL